MLDHNVAGAVLGSAARQIFDPNWPNEPGEREMVAWSPDERRSLLDRISSITDLVGASLVRIGSRLQRPATSTVK